MAHKLKPSARGELEITDANRVYLRRTSGRRKARPRLCLVRCRHAQSLLQAPEFIYTIEERQGLKIGCPEEMAYRMGYIDAAGLEHLAASIANSEYSGYLRRLLT